MSDLDQLNQELDKLAGAYKEARDKYKNMPAEEKLQVIKQFFKDNLVIANKSNKELDQQEALLFKGTNVTEMMKSVEAKIALRCRHFLSLICENDGIFDNK